MSEAFLIVSCLILLVVQEAHWLPVSRQIESAYDEFLKIEDEVQFNCPVLITYGEYDKTGYVKKYCHNWAKKTGYPLKEISNASHNANYDNYEEFNELLISFVQSL